MTVGGEPDEALDAVEDASPTTSLPTSPPTRPPLHLVPPHQHEWRLRDVEFADGICVRRYECDECGEVDFTR